MTHSRTPIAPTVRAQFSAVSSRAYAARPPHGRRDPHSGQFTELGRQRRLVGLDHADRITGRLQQERRVRVTRRVTQRASRPGLRGEGALTRDGLPEGLGRLPQRRQADAAQPRTVIRRDPAYVDRHAHVNGDRTASLSQRRRRVYPPLGTSS